MNKNIKSFEEWKNDKADERATQSGMLLVILLAMFLIAVLASCSTSQAVYRMKDGWSTVEKKSSITGWSYQNK